MTGFLNAQKQTPLWLLLEEARLAYESRDPGKAVEKYRMALEKPSNPDALAGFAKVLKDEGEYEISETYYLKALDLKKTFTYLKISTESDTSWQTCTTLHASTGNTRTCFFLLQIQTRYMQIKITLQ